MALKETFNAGMLVLVGVFDTYSITETGTSGNHVQSKKNKNKTYCICHLIFLIQVKDTMARCTVGYRNPFY